MTEHSLPGGEAIRAGEPERHSTREIVSDHLGSKKFGHNPSWVKASDYDAEVARWRASSRTPEDVYPAVEDVLAKHCRGFMDRPTTRENIAELIDKICEISTRHELAKQEAQQIVSRINNEVIGSYGYFTTPDCVVAVQKLKEDCNRLRVELASRTPETDTLCKSLSFALDGDNDERSAWLLEHGEALVEALAARSSAPTEQMHYRIPHTFASGCGVSAKGGIHWTTDTAYVTCPECVALSVPSPSAPKE